MQFLIQCFYPSGHGFSGNYEEYFGLNTDTDALNYMMVANYFLHNMYPDFMVTVAEVYICLLHSFLFQQLLPRTIFRN